MLDAFVVGHNINIKENLFPSLEIENNDRDSIDILHF